MRTTTISTLRVFLMAVSALALLSGCEPGVSAVEEREPGPPDLPEAPSEPERIRPYAENPFYWEYGGEPVLLIGGSDQDNIFNHPDLPPDGLEAHLDRLVFVGGNYIRNTMSSRDPGNVWPFRQLPDGAYDLDAWEPEYWERFEALLDMALERDMIVQIEIWDRFDFARAPWDENPFNPKNNVSYTEVESGLPLAVTTHPGERENPFFRSTPLQEDAPVVRAYQEAFVDPLLSISLPYPNVLYTISNETNESEVWSAYWADFIRDRADRRGVTVEVTEMWGARELDDPLHRPTFEDTERYSFVDISQNNHQVGQAHWDQARERRRELLGAPRPMNNVKIYGGPVHGGSFEEGTRKLWRNVFGGHASARFHRPAGAGIGLNELARTHLWSMRRFADQAEVFSMEPRNDLLGDREVDEAYAMADPGRRYAVYFPAGGSVTLDLTGTSETLTLRWLDILSGRWVFGPDAEGGEAFTLSPPGRGQWVALLEVAEGS